VAKRIAQVRMTARDPRPWIRKLRICDVPRGELGAGRRAMTHVELHDRLANAVAAHFQVPSKKPRGEAPVSQPFGLEGEKRELLDGIRETQVPIELDAVDDAERTTDADVFGAQIAVPFDDMRSARRELGRRQRHEPALCLGNLVRERLAQLSAVSTQRAPVGGDLASQATEIALAGDRRAPSVAEEPDQQRDQSIDLGVADRLPLEDVIEQPARGQAPHLDEPIHDPSALPEA
jgi:hypothetical protein